MSDFGHAAQVVRVLENQLYELDETELAEVLLKDDIKDLPVVVVSVAGAFRSGKSFLLNFFLRYLTASSTARADGSWIGKDDEPLSGFSWKSGTKLNTTGIVLWSKPFLMNLPSGEKVAVILMDTQGIVDSSSMVLDPDRIFMLSTLLSSVQIYNLSNSIPEDDLQHLKLLTEYGTMVKNEDGHKAFQALQFLVRDWFFEDDYAYGATGGETVLKDKLKISPQMTPEMKKFREDLPSTFDKVSCFLMPHPGFKVIRKSFTGKISDIDNEFIEQLKVLVPSIFSPENLIPKRINGQLIKAKHLIDFFKSYEYVTLFKSDTIPSAETIRQATFQTLMIISAEDIYNREISYVTKDYPLCLHPTDLIQVHGRAFNACNTFLKQLQNINDDEREKFLDGLKQRYAKMRMENEKNNVVLAADIGLNYLTQIKRKCDENPHLTEVDLKKEHEAALDKAFTDFELRRNLPNQRADDIYFYSMIQNIIKDFYNILKIRRGVQ